MVSSPAPSSHVSWVFQKSLRFGYFILFFGTLKIDDFCEVLFGSVIWTNISLRLARRIT